MSKVDLEELLLNAVESSIEDHKGWFELLDKVAKNHQFSFRNLILAWYQLEREPISLAGYKQWLAKGIQVQKGQKAIYVFAPKIVTDKAKDEKKLVGFIPVPVFDISQTNAPLEEAPKPKLLDGENASDLIPSLIAYATSLGYSVNLDAELSDGVNGWTIGDKKLIEIASGLSKFQTTKTLIHEIAHAMLHMDGETPRNIGEIEAESVAYVTLHKLGYDSKEYSADYIAGWAKGDAAKVVASLDTIDKTSKAILSALESLESFPS